MNKSLPWLFALLVVLLGLFWFLRKQETEVSAVKYPDRDFAVEEPSSIHRVFIADMKGRTLNLTRQPKGDWLVNDSVKASITIMDQVLYALTKIRIDHIPPATMNKTIFESISTSGIKIEVYNKEYQKIKSLVLGPVTKDESNSYMVVEGQKQPYAVKLPGRTGSLRPLFDLRSVDAWRSRDWLEIEPEEIRSVEINYPRLSGSGFSITRSGDSLQLKAASKLVEISEKAPDQRRLEGYLEGFSYVPVAIRKENFSKKDSIISLVPFVEVRISKMDGEVKELSLIPSYGRKLDGTIDFDSQFANYWVVEKPGRLHVVQVNQLKQWLKDYRSFF